MSLTARFEEFLALGAAGISDDGRQWIQVMPAAEEAKNGPWFFTITADDLSTYAASIEGNAGRIPIDYEHGGDTGGSSRAAGWMTGTTEVLGEGDVRPGENGVADGPELWAEVQWTPRAAQEIRDGEYRFLSPVFTFNQKDKKTGLMTKAKDFVAATLTNRPFFRNMAPVTAELLDSEVVDSLAELFDPDATRLILAALGGDLDAVQAAVWSTAFIDNLPDSSFLYIEPGGSKDSSGKTTPRSLRHFPVRDASGSIDMPHLRNAAARIPQSNVPADVKQRLAARVQRMLGNAQAEEQPAEEPEQITLVAEDAPEDSPAVEQPMKGTAEMSTDIVTLLGLPEHADEDTILAAVRAKDAEINKLKDEVKGFQAQVESNKALAERVAELEAISKQREIKAILDEEIRTGRVLPVEAKPLAEQFADDPDALKVLVNSRPVAMFAKYLREQGTGASGMPDPEMTAVKAEFKNGDPVDEDSARLHLRAMAILREQNKEHDHTAEDYSRALESAARSITFA